VFIFQIGTALNVAASTSIAVADGAAACNVYWAVGSSTVIGLGASVAGTIVAQQAISSSAGVVVSGSLLSSVAAVSFTGAATVGGSLSCSASGITSKKMTLAATHTTTAAAPTTTHAHATAKAAVSSRKPAMKRRALQVLMPAKSE